MRDIAILMPCWKAPELLRISVPSILNSLTTDSELIVILNEPDHESMDILADYRLDWISSIRNLGPSAVDMAIPRVKKFKYVCNVNSDMLFHQGWDRKVIDLMEKNQPCSVSNCLVEPVPAGHVVYDDLGDFLDPTIALKFNLNVGQGKYTTKTTSTYNHPITTTSEDFIKVNGYSDNMDETWIELHGRGLDNHFAWRLYNLHNQKYRFIKSTEAFTYHAISLNSKKITNRKPGGQAFHEKTGITFQQFSEMLKLHQENPWG